MAKAKENAKKEKSARGGRLPIRLSDEERAEFERKAAEAGSPSLAAYLRECGLPDTPEAIDALRHYGSAGSEN